MCTHACTAGTACCGRWRCARWVGTKCHTKTSILYASSPARPTTNAKHKHPQRQPTLVCMPASQMHMGMRHPVPCAPTRRRTSSDFFFLSVDPCFLQHESTANNRDMGNHAWPSACRSHSVAGDKCGATAAAAGPGPPATRGRCRLSCGASGAGMAATCTMQTRCRCGAAASSPRTVGRHVSNAGYAKSAVGRHCPAPPFPQPADCPCKRLKCSSNPVAAPDSRGGGNALGAGHVV